MTATQACKAALLMLVAVGCGNKPSPLKTILPDLPHIDRVMCRYLDRYTEFDTKVVLSSDEVRVGDIVRIRVDGINEEYIQFISCPGGRIFPYKGNENYQYSLKVYKSGEMTVRFYVEVMAEDGGAYVAAEKNIMVR